MSNRILVVDDDKNIGQILHASFSAKGYEVYIARNGEDALTEFSRVIPDLVLLDVLLPKMNGWEVCQKMKSTSNGSAVPVILMSAIYKTPKMQMDAKQKYGADEFVEKPFQLSRLMELVAEFIGDPKAKTAEEVVITIEESAPEAEAPVQESAPILLEGEFSFVSFPELLHDLYVVGKSGHLVVSCSGKKKDISILEGYPVSVATNLEDEFFGNFLVRQHVITPEQRDEAVRRMFSSGRLIGTVMIEMDVLTPQQVVNYLRMQVRDKLFEIFSWSEGAYRFSEDPYVTGDIQNVEMSVANIINEGVRRHYRFDRLNPLIAGYRGKYLQLGTNLRYRFQDLDLTPTEAKVFGAIDGTKTFDDVSVHSPVPPERTLQILYTLIMSGMVEPVLGPSDKPQTNLYDVEVAKADLASPSSETADTEAEADEESEISIEIEPETTEAPAAPKTSSEPTPAPSVDENGDEARVRTRILTYYEKLSESNLFEILNVSDNPTESEVRVAYHKLAKEFHPDRYFGKASGEIKAKVEEIFRAINEAYDSLNTQEKIIDYKNQLAGQMPPEEEKSARIMGVKKIIYAEQRFQQGLQNIKDKRYTRAAAAFREALELAPMEPEYIAYYGWALYNIPYERDADEEELALRPKESMADIQFEARESLNRAISLNPRTEKAYLFLGAIYKQQGLTEFAEKQYEKALICNPNSIEAMRELRLIKLKEQQSKVKKKGLFDRFLKR